MNSSVFEAPHFTFWTTVYTAIGAAVFWSRSGRTKLRVYYLSNVLDILKMPEGRFRQALEFIVFVALGCVIGIGIAKPMSVAQALTAGFAWTSWVAKRG